MVKIFGGFTNGWYETFGSFTNGWYESFKFSGAIPMADKNFLKFSGALQMVETFGSFANDWYEISARNSANFLLSWNFRVPYNINEKYEIYEDISWLVWQI